MQSRLPSLNAIRAFEAAARHLSFKSAAAELHVTPSAISHQIRLMEADLGFELFLRSANAIKLTETAERMLPQLTAGLDLIRRTVAPEIISGRERLLYITTLPTFAARWFLPRMQRFYSQNPACRISIDASAEVVNLQQSRFDCAIRNGGGNWPGLLTDRLFGERLTPVCSPRLLRESRCDLTARPTLHVQTRPKDWPVWLATAGLTKDGKEEIWLSSRSLAIQGAIEGLGYALVDPSFIADDLASGRLTLSHPKVHSASAGTYYLVYREEASRNYSFQQFRTWVLQEASAYAANSIDRRQDASAV
ncbi:LysR family glycine cleavage system transcriptional activator [Bradyrhizobium sp. cir1]|uniref:LysR substrate-binding domain-containing protein n=1 Tax=Bradyrhizobium sp. cir1 TaxID=1445730 RepID=UPI001605761E|nr:LysR substrate-binding domain-containing protein [Bradyrhizobium sp. cir1]MBB4368360.1 LysR family glycine cleavage system transcriptional activator [Bradyrhizobium sp. cir1]